MEKDYGTILYGSLKMRANSERKQPRGTYVILNNEKEKWVKDNTYSFRPNELYAVCFLGRSTNCIHFKNSKVL